MLSVLNVSNFNTLVFLGSESSHCILTTDLGNLGQV
jgi:hypothetical protein